MPPPYNPPTSPDQTLDNFIYYVNLLPKPDLAGVMKQFDPNPAVGITSYGPQFNGFAQVQMLFRQLFFAFTNLTFTEQQPTVRLYSTPGPLVPPMTGTQVNLSGQHTGGWFAKGTQGYSPPLSDIDPDWTRMMNLDACAVFTFNPPGNPPGPTAHLIKRLAIYFDRYLMAQQLTVPTAKGSSSTSGG